MIACVKRRKCLRSWDFGVSVSRIALTDGSSSIRSGSGIADISVFLPFRVFASAILPLDWREQAGGESTECKREQKDCEKSHVESSFNIASSSKVLAFHSRYRK